MSGYESLSLLALYLRNETAGGQSELKGRGLKKVGRSAEGLVTLTRRAAEKKTRSVLVLPPQPFSIPEKPSNGGGCRLSCLEKGDEFRRGALDSGPLSHAALTDASRQALTTDR